WGGSGYYHVPRKALRFISFHQIDYQMKNIA
ncbi:MAG: membrane protein insertion efficiency factor YidD, partial [Acinetobacter sp.]